MGNKKFRIVSPYIKRSFMFSNLEIKIRNECRRKCLDPDEILQLMQVPYEWREDGYLFDFNSLSVEKLSNYVDYIFRKQGYSLDNGTQINGVYVKNSFGDSLAYKRLPIKYKFKVKIYSNEQKTCLKISIEFQGSLMSADKKIYGNNYLNPELNKIFDQIKFLKPSIKGYLVCDKCGAYYEIHQEESQEDFLDNCECGGTLKYIASPDLPDEKIVKQKRIARPTEYLRAPTVLIIVSLVCISTVVYYTSEILTLGIIGLAISMVFVLIRIKSQELVMNTLSRRLLYFLVAILFFVESWALNNISLPINSNSIMTVVLSISMILALVFGLGMIFKVITPDNPRNFLDPPL
jgi:hypothetical protein